MAEDKVNTAKTDPIVERLTAEGKLLRNSGSNSIKSVKIELAKFANVFESIQMATTSTAKALGTLDEQAKDGNKKQDDLIEQIKNASEEDQRRAQEALTNKKENDSESKGLWDRLSGGLSGLGKSIKSGFASMKENSFNFLKKAAQFLIFGPILLGAIKGVLDGIFGENKVQEVFTKIAESNFTKFILNHPWDSFRAALVAFSLVRFGPAIAAMLASAKMLALSAGGGGTDIIPGAPGDKDGKDNKGGKNKKGKFKFGKSKYGLAAAALVAGGVGLFNQFGDDEDDETEIAKMEDKIKEINENAIAAEEQVVGDALSAFEKDRIGLTDVLADAAISAGIGFAAGGPIGAGVAAAGSVAFSGLMAGITGVYDIFADIDELSNETESLVKKERLLLNSQRKKLTESDRANLILQTNNKLIEERDRLASEGAEIDDVLKVLKENLENPSSLGTVKNASGNSVTVRRLERQIANLEEDRLLLAKQEAVSARIINDRLAAVETKPVAEVVGQITDNIVSQDQITPVVPQTAEQMKDASTSVAPPVVVVNNVGGATNINAAKTDNNTGVTKTITQTNLGGGGGGGNDVFGLYPNGSS